MNGCSCSASTFADDDDDNDAGLVLLLLLLLLVESVLPSVAESPRGDLGDNGRGFSTGFCSRKGRVGLAVEVDLCCRCGVTVILCRPKLVERLCRSWAGSWVGVDDDEDDDGEAGAVDGRESFVVVVATTTTSPVLLFELKFSFLTSCGGAESFLFFSSDAGATDCCCCCFLLLLFLLTILLPLIVNFNTLDTSQLLFCASFSASSCAAAVPI